MKRFLFAFAVVYAAGAAVPGTLAIRNARIVPVSSPVIPQGTVVVRDGLIDAVGPDVPVPPDAWVIEGQGLTVYPGLMDALSTLGIPDASPARPGGAQQTPGQAPPATPPAPAAQGPEDRPATTSWVRAADLVRPADNRLEAARRSGFTTAAMFPARGIFAGQGAVINLAGDKPGQMVIASPVGQYVTLSSSGFGGGFPASLMGTIAYIRQVFLDADYYKRAKEFYAAHPRGTLRPEYDRALEGVLESPRILLPATRRVDVDRMLRFSSELKVNALLYGLPEGYRSADLLKNSRTPVLVSLKWPAKPRDGDPEEVDSLRVIEMRDKAPSTAAVLARNGVQFAFYSDGLNRRTELLRAVRRAIDAGLSPDDALRAMTLAPAEIYGVADRLGSVEKGKIANLLVTRGDLFQEKAEVMFVVIDGRKIEPLPDVPQREQP